MIFSTGRRLRTAKDAEGRRKPIDARRHENHLISFGGISGNRKIEVRGYKALVYEYSAFRLAEPSRSVSPDPIADLISSKTTRIDGLACTL